MRIRSVDATTISIPTKRPMRWGGGAYFGMNAILVTLHTDTGLVGYGECNGRCSGTPETVRVAVEAFGQRLKGFDPFEVERARQMFFHEDRWINIGAFGGVVFAGIEMALWDLVGKSLNQPVHRLMGGALRDRINHFGYVMKSTPEEMAKDALDFVEQGYKVLYVKVGYGIETDETFIAEIRGAVGNRARLRIDTAGEWDVGTAIRALRRFERYDIEFAEQPVARNDIAGHIEVKNRTGIPIALNQSLWTGNEVLEAVRRRACDVVVLGPQWAGGIYELKKIAYMLELENIPICRHSAEMGIATCASLQVSATIPNLMDGNQIYITHLTDDVLAEPLVLSGGDIKVPLTPGLGADPDPAKLTKYAELYRREGGFGVSRQ